MKGNSIFQKWIEGKLDLNSEKDSEDVKFLKKIEKELDKRKSTTWDAELELEKFRSLHKEAKQFHLFPAGSGFRIAAAISILIVASISYFLLPYLSLSNQVEVITQSGEVKIHYLPDSSVVTLNGASSIAYNNEDWEDNRTIELTGEAFFEVQKGSSFLVSSDHGTVEVLGTKFNVRDRVDFYEVECYEGMVAVSAPDYKLQSKLKKGRRVQVIKSEVSGIKETTITKPTWLNNRIAFQSVPIKTVIEEIERQFDISIELKNIDENQIFSGSFSNKDVKIALLTVSETLNVKFSFLSDRKVLIYSE